MLNEETYVNRENTKMVLKKMDDEMRRVSPTAQKISHMPL